LETVGLRPARIGRSEPCQAGIWQSSASIVGVGRRIWQSPASIVGVGRRIYQSPPQALLVARLGLANPSREKRGICQSPASIVGCLARPQLPGSDWQIRAVKSGDLPILRKHCRLFGSAPVARLGLANPSREKRGICQSPASIVGCWVPNRKAKNCLSFMFCLTNGGCLLYISNTCFIIQTHGWNMCIPLFQR